MNESSQMSLAEVRVALSRVKLGSRPSWPIKALFGAVFQLIFIVEQQERELTELKEMFVLLDGQVGDAAGDAAGDALKQSEFEIDDIKPKSVWI